MPMPPKLSRVWKVQGHSSETYFGDCDHNDPKEAVLRQPNPVASGMAQSSKPQAALAA